MNLPLRTRFTADEAESANETWGANCGPGALAAICGLTLDDVRPLIPEFERKGYTNPAMMNAALLKLQERRRIRCFQVSQIGAFPAYGLARIQWEGRWTQPGVPARVAYGYTHWVGACEKAKGRIGAGIFDINCVCPRNPEGWIRSEAWAAEIVPIMTANMKGASGGWHVTHSINITLPESAR